METESKIPSKYSQLYKAVYQLDSFLTVLYLNLFSILCITAVIPFPLSYVVDLISFILCFPLKKLNL